MKKILTALSILLIGVSAQAQKVSSYEIDVHFFPKDAQMWGYAVSDDAFMRGNTSIEFSEITADVLTFYLHGELKIDSITSGVNHIEYTSEKVLYENNYSLVGLKTSFNTSSITSGKKLRIHYSGFMNPSRARSLSDYMRINKDDGVYLRANYYSLWFPVFLLPDEDDYEVEFKKITLKLPANFKAVVSGELLEEVSGKKYYTAYWKPGLTKMSDIQCTARKYDVISKENLSIYHISNPEQGETIIDFVEQLKTLFSSNLRNIHNTTPLYIIEMPEYGNISSQNVIGISTDVYDQFEDDLYSKRTIAHELVHPYVSIPIAKNDPFSALITEGFPSFFYLYGLERILSKEDFDLKDYMKRVEKSYIKKKQTGKDRRGNPLPIEKPILKIAFDEIGHYKDLFILPDRASLFLYHLWANMGDQKYDLFLRELFQLDSIDYDKFERLIENYIPNYSNNLNTWLNTTEYPQSLHIKD
ncbi:MAG: hypothetical protein MI974_23710 [Chitinophagales bacterium]|nr:hypothetical protein [Chitinophagales bacterium]